MRFRIRHLPKGLQVQNEISAWRFLISSSWVARFVLHSLCIPAVTLTVIPSAPCFLGVGHLLRFTLHPQLGLTGNRVFKVPHQL